MKTKHSKDFAFYATAKVWAMATLGDTPYDIVGPRNWIELGGGRYQVVWLEDAP